MFTFDRVHIGVYAIAKNESKFVKRFIKSMYNNGYGCDRLYVLDTGSTDNTVKLFYDTVNELHIPHEWLVLEQKNYEQFRFDVARNDNLDMIKPDEDELDAVITIDIDEVMIPEFWDDCRGIISQHPDFEWIYYNYALTHDENDKPTKVYLYNKLHPPKGYRWKNAVHEELYKIFENDRSGSYTMDTNIVYLHHFPDKSKSRNAYVNLLELNMAENPNDINRAYYLVKEYIIRRNFIKALALGTTMYAKFTSDKYGIEDTHKAIPFTMLAIAECYDNLNMPEPAEFFYQETIRVYRHLRQAYIDYASFLGYSGRPSECCKILDDMKNNTVPNPENSWYENDSNYTWRPMQIRAVALCWFGKYQEAKELFEEAIDKYIKTATDEFEANKKNFYSDYHFAINAANN